MTRFLPLFFIAIAASPILAEIDGGREDKRGMQMVEHNGHWDLIQHQEDDFDNERKRLMQHNDQLGLGYVRKEKRDPRAHRTEMFDDLTQIYILGQPPRNLPQFCTLFYHPGSGGARLQKYYYSLKDKMCLPFIYGGKNGNKNRFDTFDDCMRTCNVSDVY
ncbi:hypothetical protein ACTXT7_015022 [Hymenolepis weldensis]